MKVKKLIKGELKKYYSPFFKRYITIIVPVQS